MLESPRLSLPVSKVVETDNNDSSFDPQNQVFYAMGKNGDGRPKGRRRKSAKSLLGRPSLQSNRERIREVIEENKAPAQAGGRQSDRMM
jgi:hypothetical protein